MPTRVTLSPNDSLWLNMDTPENLMIIESIMWFSEPLDEQAVLETLRTRLLERYPVFGWRAEASTSAVGVDHWVEDPEFALENHLTVHELAGEAHDEVVVSINLDGPGDSTIEALIPVALELADTLAG